MWYYCFRPLSDTREIMRKMAKNTKNREFLIKNRFFQSGRNCPEHQYMAGNGCLVCEHDYFRSPGRGVSFRKIAIPFFSVGRTDMRRRALESPTLLSYQKIFFVSFG